MARIGLGTIFCSLVAMGCADPSVVQPAPRQIAVVVDTTKDSAVAALRSAAPLTDPRDTKTYRTVSVGDSNFVWMAQNLDHDTLGGKLTWCPTGDARYCGVYGRLYSWQVAIRAKDSTVRNLCEVGDPYAGICPSGWHLPSLAEWDSLFALLGGIERAGRILKSPVGWVAAIDGDSGGGVNSLFAALPAGYHFTGDQGFGLYGHTPSDSAFFDVGRTAAFWTRSFAMPGSCSNAWSVFLTSDVSRIDTVAVPRANALSVRCVKDPK